MKDSLSNKVFETVVDRGGIGRDALYIDPPDAIRQHRLDPHRKLLRVVVVGSDIQEFRRLKAGQNQSLIPAHTINSFLG